MGVAAAVLCLCLTLCRPWRRLKTYKHTFAPEPDAASSPKSSGSTQHSVFKEAEFDKLTPRCAPQLARFPPHSPLLTLQRPGAVPAV